MARTWRPSTALAAALTLAAALPLWSAPAACGQTARVWESAVSDNFAVASRWNPDGKPTGSDTARFDQLGTYSITFTMNESFGALAVEAGAVDWLSAAARTVNVTSINVANNGTDWRLRGDVRVVSSGVTTLNASNGTLVLNGGRLTAATLQVSQGTLIGNNSASLLDVTGASNIGGQGTFATVNLSAGMTANFGNVNLAPAGVGASSVGQMNLSSGATTTIDGNLVVGNVTADNRQGVIVVKDAGTALTQVGARSITLGRIQVGAPSGDNSSRIEVSDGAVATSGTGAITLNGLGHINVHPGGTFNANGAATINNGGELNISGGAYNAAAAMTVNAGGAVNHTGGTLNRSANLTIDGGVFTQSGTASEAIGGNPNVTVQNGGSYSTGLSYSLPSASVTLVTGAGSTLHTDGFIFAPGGAGTALTVNAGGVVTADALSLGSSGVTATVVDGVGSRLTANLAASTLGAGAFTVRNGGRADLGATSLGNVGAVATLNVQTGATLFLGDFDAGNAGTAGSIGLLNVTGAGTAATQTGAAALRLGAAAVSSANLSVSSGGQFATGTGLGRVNAQGTINVGAGGTFIENGALTVEGGQIQASAGTFVIAPGSSLTLRSAALGSLGAFALNSGAQVIVDGAELQLADLAPNGGSVSFLGGLTTFTQSTALTGGKLNALFGANASLLGGRTLQVQGTATLQSQLTLDGGVFTANALAGGALMNLRNGTVNLTGSSLAVGVSGAFGANLLLGAGVSVNVQAGTATVDAGSLLWLTGGQLTSSGALTNNGEIRLDSTLTRLTPASLTNNGTISGTGRVNASVTNQLTGILRSSGAERLVLAGAATTNNGTIDLVGGTIEFTGQLINSGGAAVSGRGALNASTAAPGGVGIVNSGVMQFSAGTMDIRGDVANNAAGVITTGGAGVTTFFDDVVNQGQIRTSAGSRTVLFGSLSGAGSFPGSGTVELLGDTRPGNSPAEILFGGDLVFGETARLTLELGGLTPGIEYDRLTIAHDVFLDGQLELALINGFLPQFGNSFLILDNQGTNPIHGTFAGLAEGASVFAGGSEFRISYFGGNGNDIVLTAVPEPTTLALFGLATAGAGGAWWRRRQNRLLAEACEASQDR